MKKAGIFFVISMVIALLLSLSNITLLNSAIEAGDVTDPLNMQLAIDAGDVPDPKNILKV